MIKIHRVSVDLWAEKESARIVSLLVLPSIVPPSRHNMRWNCANMIAGYKGRLIYIPQCIKTQLQPTLRERTQESESTPSKLVDDLDVAASPRYVGDSRCNLVYSLISPSLLPSQLCVLAHRRLAFRDIYGQSINSVHYTFPFHGRVYRQGLKYLFLPRATVLVWLNRLWSIILLLLCQNTRYGYYKILGIPRHAMVAFSRKMSGQERQRS